MAIVYSPDSKLRCQGKHKVLHFWFITIAKGVLFLRPLKKLGNRLSLYHQYYRNYSKANQASENGTVRENIIFKTEVHFASEVITICRGF